MIALQLPFHLTTVGPLAPYKSCVSHPCIARACTDCDPTIWYFVFILFHKNLAHQPTQPNTQPKPAHPPNPPANHHQPTQPPNPPNHPTTQPNHPIHTATPTPTSVFSFYSLVSSFQFQVLSFVVFFFLRGGC